MDKIKVILNPYAGRWLASRLRPVIEETLTALDIPFELELTTKPGTGIEMARQASLDGFSVVVAAGGDGTVSEVVNGLALAADDLGKPTAGILGVLPVGSANDMAEIAGVPIQLRAACEAIKRGRTRRIDLGVVNGRYFDNNVGAGFEAQVTIESRKIKLLRGTLLYLIAVFRALSHYPSPTMRITWDDGELQRSLLMVSIGNGRRTGGGFFVTPDAVQDDGLLDLGVANALPRLQILQLLPKVMRGTHKNDPAIFLTRSTHITVESDYPLPVHADGEIIYTDAKRLDISIQPARLEMIV
ncbi:MAG: diacylglycerol kinase family protein [Anaerolineae bacterium]